MSLVYVSNQTEFPLFCRKSSFYISFSITSFLEHNRRRASIVDFFVKRWRFCWIESEPCVGLASDSRSCAFDSIFRSTLWQHLPSISYRFWVSLNVVLFYSEFSVSLRSNFLVCPSIIIRKLCLMKLPRLWMSSVSSWKNILRLRIYTSRCRRKSSMYIFK